MSTVPPPTCWPVTSKPAIPRTPGRASTTPSPSIFVVATTIALTDLLIKDTSGDTGLPPLLGWIGMLPCLAGLLAVGLLWRDPNTPDGTASTAVTAHYPGQASALDRRTIT
jgi:hypothetical protein